MDTKTWMFMLGGLVLAAALAFAVSPFASSSPDGLDRVSQDHGFAEQAEKAQVWHGAPIPDYSFPGVEGRLATSVAGLVGTLAVAAIGYAGAIALRARRRVGSPNER